MNTLSMEIKKQVLNALVEGCSIRSIERMTGVHRDTIMRLMLKIGEKCQKILDLKLQEVKCKFLEVDEIWTFVKKKEKRIKEEEAFDFTIGDQYIFVALDAQTKLILCFQTGKRNEENARSFIMDLSQRIYDNGRIQLTTDGFRSYIPAVGEAFGCYIDYAQLIKIMTSEAPDLARYTPPPRVKEVVSKVITGKPNPNFISTSYVERQNLTMRMQMRRLTRLTNAFSKKLENLKAALALHFFHYNFMRKHLTLKTTPAVKAGIENKVWWWENLFAFVI